MSSAERSRVSKDFALLRQKYRVIPDEPSRAILGLIGSNKCHWADRKENLNLHV